VPSGPGGEVAKNNYLKRRSTFPIILCISFLAQKSLQISHRTFGVMHVDAKPNQYN
jgi:hypothetical protein